MAITVTQVDIWTALVHGLISFLSPCALPLLPSFVALLLYDKGESAFFRIVGFFLGLSGTFSALGALSGVLGGFLNRNLLRYVSGSLIIVMGVLFLLQVQLFKPRTVKLNRFTAGGILSGIGLGLGVGMVWIPCASPVLASISGDRRHEGNCAERRDLALHLFARLIHTVLDDRQNHIEVAHQGELWNTPLGKDLEVRNERAALSHRIFDHQWESLRLRGVV
jgi:hypothetical protein